LEEWMDKDGYYIVTEGGAPAVEEVSEVGGKTAVVCERPDLAEEGETLEPVTFDDLAFLLEARADIGYVHIRTPEGSRTIEKPVFLRDVIS
jgi:hypothetical protein